MFGYLLLISVSAVLMAVLNSHNIFVLPCPASHPVLRLRHRLATLLLYRRLGVFSMAVGVLTGGLTAGRLPASRLPRLGYGLQP